MKENKNKAEYIFYYPNVVYFMLLKIYNNYFHLTLSEILDDIFPE